MEHLEDVEHPRIEVGPRVLSDLDKALSLEWIVVNGLGGYSSSTVIGVNTRKYHGLLVASFEPPSRRYVVLSKLDEEVRVDPEGDCEERTYGLGSNEFRGLFHPDGYRFMVGFSLDPYPTFRYEAGGVYVAKRVVMPYGKNMVVSSYWVLNTLREAVEFRVRPLVVMRHIYEVTDVERSPLSFRVDPLGGGGGFILSEPNYPYRLMLYSTSGEYTPDPRGGFWIRRIYLRADGFRGEECLDDNYSPGSFRFRVEPEGSGSLHLVASAWKDGCEPPDGLERLDRDRVERLLEGDEDRVRASIRGSLRKVSEAAPEGFRWLKDEVAWLLGSAGSFIVETDRPKGLSVIAGYHWFGLWGRDALISLPGLTLVTGRFGDAAEILETMSLYCRDGLIPNCIPERPFKADVQPSYNSVDSSLWFVNAVFQYLKYTGDFGFVSRRLWGAMKSIIDSYIEGTRFGIRMDGDCLLKHGPQLTWMDVVVGGVPVTPRSGKAVEVEALWYNALRIMEFLACKFGYQRDASNYHWMAVKAKESFNAKFWNSEGGYLFDVVEGERRDPSLRPNQIFAVSLDFPLLGGSRAVRVVEVVWRRLWATYGLRTLDRSDPRYVGRYVGGWAQRDRAYHNGTVWAWLIGPFVTAFLKVKGYGEKWRRFAAEAFFRPLLVDEPLRAGLGSFSEIFDGDPPHTPRGCISQAWSVAEPLRALLEDVLYVRPPFERELLG